MNEDGGGGGGGPVFTEKTAQEECNKAKMALRDSKQTSEQQTCKRSHQNHDGSQIFRNRGR